MLEVRPKFHVILRQTRREEQRRRLAVTHVSHDHQRITARGSNSISGLLALAASRVLLFFVLLIAKLFFTAIRVAKYLRGDLEKQADERGGGKAEERERDRDPLI
jgi:hypothetical protein